MRGLSSWQSERGACRASCNLAIAKNFASSTRKSHTSTVRCQHHCLMQSLAHGHAICRPKSTVSEIQLAPGHRPCCHISGKMANKEISIKRAAASVSTVGGQGFIFCGCKGPCGGKCKCKKAGLACGSKCHGGQHNPNCKNKEDCAEIRNLAKI